MREIVLDTETTGLEANLGDRIIEIGCVELIDLIPSGRELQQYFDPGCQVSPDSQNIHGLSNEFLQKFGAFASFVPEFLAFIGDSPLIIHNAAFDMQFINKELINAGYEQIPKKRVIDTLAQARSKFPGARVSLDELCKRFSIDSSAREKHGALCDSRILAQVYLELSGGRAPGFGFQQTRPTANTVPGATSLQRMARPKSLPSRLQKQEKEAHSKLVAQLKGTLWPTGDSVN